MGHIQRRHLTEAKVICPEPSVTRRLSAILEPLIEKMVSCKLEQYELGALRDTLLPKLLSGGLSVPRESAA